METAYISVVPGREVEFLAALPTAIKILESAPGYRGVHIHRGVERNSTIMLAIAWNELADHTEGFRQSPLFGQWRALISPFFAENPQVEHWELLN